MRNDLATFFLFAPLALTAGHLKAADLELNVLNATTERLMFLNIVPASSKSWGQDLLPEPIDAFQYTDINLTDGKSICTYHLRAEFSDWEVIEDYNVNLCHDHHYTFEDY
ncbi:hypothetical protein [Phaeobacter sp. 11ANDIMAR09]|uniref:hypothetical protein n=1 Tax=Phaeobacter sp. 11ANDIMAR09 TaxID=1225647 RepID=UPI0006C8D9DC|nr:hypothetical protein [Phaeobacter sp. 11ANDIMAR09]KPD12329.1 hypothetical protein AN476_10445 [Phaeobacter sp. 11ANDIMAR09]